MSSEIGNTIFRKQKWVAIAKQKLARCRQFKLPKAECLAWTISQLMVYGIT
jgi:hypothetical protein